MRLRDYAASAGLSLSYVRRVVRRLELDPNDTEQLDIAFADLRERGLQQQVLETGCHIEDYYGEMVA